MTLKPGSYFVRVWFRPKDIERFHVDADVTVESKRAYIPMINGEPIELPFDQFEPYDEPDAPKLKVYREMNLPPAMAARLRRPPESP